MAVIHIKDEDFDEVVLKSDKPVLLDFFATWCGPCQMLSPVIEEISEERTDIKVVKVDTDECPEIAEQFNVMSIPTLVVMNQGRVMNQSVGFRPKDDIIGMLS